MAFTLDLRLAADTIYVTRLRMCDLLMMNDRRYPWTILVPRIAGARELHELSLTEGADVWAEIMLVATAIGAWDGVEKVNIGALGNMVAQLHIHIIGRQEADAAWPGAVWGHSPREPYEVGEMAAFKNYLGSSLTIG